MRTFLFATIAIAAACSDPVPDGAVSTLGPEIPTIPVGEYHRAGQPCVNCHRTGGVAQTAFTLAGTVFAQPGNAVGVDQATVAFTDTLGSVFTTKTNCVGNFFVTKDQWDPSFPILVRVFKDGVSLTMQSQVGRERSCANCHKDPDNAYQALSSVGHLFLYQAGSTAPPPATTCPVSPIIGSQ